MSEEDPESRKGRLWKIDPEMFQSRSKPKGIASRIGARIKALGLLIVVALFFMYPFWLIYMGIVYGAIGFWGSFIGSAILIGLAIERAGYSRNFDNFGTGSFARGLVMLVVAFGMTVAFMEGLFVARIWLLPAMLFVLLLGLTIKLLKG